MYEIVVDSEQFSGKRLVQQHRMVTEVRHSHFMHLKIVSAFPLGAWTCGEDAAWANH